MTTKRSARRSARAHALSRSAGRSAVASTPLGIPRIRHAEDDVWPSGPKATDNRPEEVGRVVPCTEPDIGPVPRGRADAHDLDSPTDHARFVRPAAELACNDRDLEFVCERLAELRE